MPYFVTRRCEVKKSDYTHINQDYFHTPTLLLQEPIHAPPNSLPNDLTWQKLSLCEIVIEHRIQISLCYYIAKNMTGHRFDARLPIINIVNRVNDVLIGNSKIILLRCWRRFCAASALHGHINQIR